MKKTRIWTSAIAVVALTIGALGFAVPAQAASSGSITDQGNGSATVTWLGFPSIAQVLIQIGGCSGPGIPCFSLFPNSGVAGSVNIVEGLVLSGFGGSQPLPSGDYEIKLIDTSVGGPPYPSAVAQSNGAIQIGSGGGGGGTSSGEAASAPVEVSLSLDLAASGASCTSGSAATGLVGTWLSLPGAGDCTSQTTPEANLLGWATTADFPVDIAQRQIDSGWGAYELFNDEGRMTAVFIPAGGATFVSAGNTLHPIWAS